MELLQSYWWLLIAILGGVLVFLLFVQGGQSMLIECGSKTAKNLIVNAVGRKWELTFTTLVVFGGAFFASFPLFYSTSFGGAYWLWMAILFSFVVQAVSFEFRRKKGNIYGTGFYDFLLLVNGFVGCLLLGVAVGTLFFGAHFTVTRGNILDAGSPVISVWAPTHGLEAICSWKNLLVGVVVFFLARTNAALYFINSVDGGEKFKTAMRRRVLLNGALFVIFFLALLYVYFTANGFMDLDGVIEEVPYAYINNIVKLWWLLAVLVIGVGCVLFGYIRTLLKSDCRSGIWWTGFGTVLAIVALLCNIGFDGMCYMPSLTDTQSSLSLSNSSSTEFTLTVMSWVSLIIPFVIAYIWVVWRKMNARPLTTAEVNNSHSY